MRRVASTSVLLVLLPLSAIACGDGRYDAKTPGEPIGRFAMTGTLERDECQAAVLGVVDPWQFDLRLSRFVEDLYWLNGREAISGVLASDERSFSFETAVDVTLQPARGRRAACVVSRRDSASGSLSPSARDATRVEAELSFTYQAGQVAGQLPGQMRGASDCSDIIGVSGGFASLPCRIDFRLSGERVDDER
jgi:hypothetical protein